ncbi:MAG: hypothetical protein AAFZ65_15075 [Planctomycetota bacterium]
MTPPTERDPQDPQTTLEEFLIACQKSLARAAASATEASKSDSEFVQGERPVYVIEGIDFDLNAGVHIGEAGTGAPDSVHLHFGAATDERSRLRFRVEKRPMEILSGAKLELANLDVTGEDLPLVRMRAWLVDDKGVPVPNYPVVLHFARAGDKRLRDSEKIEVQTDVVGRVDFYVDTSKGEKNLKLIGVRARKTVHVRGSARGIGLDQFYVWATCARHKDWRDVVEPAAPHPPREVARDKDGELLELCSELIRITLKETDDDE